VAAKIVHDDDVAWPEHGNELLLDISAEAFAVDWAIEDAWCRELVAAQGAEEGQGPPVAMRGKGSDALALRSPSPQRSHVGLDPGLVDEHQPLRIEPGLPGLPALSLMRDGSTSSLKSEQRFF